MVAMLVVLQRGVMAEIGVTAFKATASAVIKDVEAGTAYVVTKRGRPVAVLLPLEEAEDLALANADEYERMRQQARAAHAKGRATSLDDLP